MLLVIAGSTVGAAPAGAEEPVLSRVTYTVSAEAPTRTTIFYRPMDPPNWADYSHDPYRYSPKIEVDLQPGQPWTFETTLRDPNRWALVVATGRSSQGPPNMHCALTVDSVEVAVDSGPAGALCSLRLW